MENPLLLVYFDIYLLPFLYKPGFLNLFLSLCFVSCSWCLWQRLIEEENMLAPSLKQFSLRVEMLPSYIPVRVAEKILFVGESVQMFENQNVNLTRKGKEHLSYGLLSAVKDWQVSSKILYEWIF